MVLTDVAISNAFNEGRLVIDPFPAEGQFDPTAVNLRVSDQFFRWRLKDHEKQFGELPAIRVDRYDYSLLAADFLEEIIPDDDGCVTIRSGELILTSTIEKVGFPAGGGLAGRVEGKSSLARLGLSVHFAPTLHHTWVGHITLELHNAGPAPLKLHSGVSICQLIVETISGKSDRDMEGTRFQDQKSPKGRVVDPSAAS